MAQLDVTLAPVLSTALLVKVKEPGAVGVPVIAPVDAFNVSPGGREPDEIE
jgi:hypothetical protein